MGLLKKYKSFTLIETIVAVVITMICTSIAFATMLNIEKAGNNFKKIQSHLFLLKELNSTIKEKKFIDENINHENFTFVKTITPYQNIDKLYLLKIIAYDNSEKKLDEVKELVVIDE